MKTRWTDQVFDHPLPEYPRPQFKRDSYLNLNGWWDCAINHEEAIPESFSQKILVPFSPEAPLSGVNHILQQDEIIWYRRTFLLDEGFLDKRVILHFGAVDQVCEVFLNDREIGRNIGGYYPFSIDITEDVRKENELLVKVEDYTDLYGYETGKQHLEPGRIWYTPQSGIWQTVWLEAVEKEYIKSVRITPDLKNRKVFFDFDLCGEDDLIDITITYKEKELLKTNGKNMTEIVINEIHEWSPEDPALYDVSFEYKNDRVESYFAMRSIEVKKAKDGHVRLFLNGKPYFCNGLLDQGYWPDGLYTAPCEEAMVSDIMNAKNLGFNTIRKHIKIEPSRWYYLCDRYGLLVFQDMPNGGRDYSLWNIMLFQLFRGPIKDDERHYKGFGRTQEEGRKQFSVSLERMIRHLYNSPSIVVWIPFNEGWGQFDSLKICESIRELDHTRLIDHASGWHDQGGGDIDSHHRYILKVKVKADRRGNNRAFVLSEFGGYKLKLYDHSYSQDELKSYHVYDDISSLNAAIRKLYQKTVLANIPKGMAGCIYTQVSDIEDEVNGIMTYDREVVKLQKDTLTNIFEEIGRVYQDY